MARWILVAVFVAIAPAFGWAAEPAARWPQFRGPGGQGLVADGAKLPREFGPDKNVLWKMPLPRGHSSPCVWDDRIFVTGCESGSKNLETICLDRTTGRIVWRQGVTVDRLEVVHSINSHASSTPATDGQHVYSYFGSYGMVCYDREGKEVWKRPLEPIPGRFGSGQSPAVAGDFVLINMGKNVSNTLVALNRKTGEIVWEKSRFRGFATGLWSTPAIRPVEGGHEVLAVGGDRVIAYNVADGSERWFVRGLPNVSLNTPAIAEGMACFTLSNPVGDGDNVVQLPSFEDALKKWDKNGDGTIQFDEIPADATAYTRGRDDKQGDWSPLRQQSRRFDADRDGALNAEEWKAVAAAQANQAESVAIAVVCLKFGGKGDVSGTHVIWKQTKSAPEVPSPLIYRGRAYLVSERGMLTCRELATGRELYRERLGTRGTVYSSPVAGDGRILIASDGGTLVTIKEGDKFEVLSKVQFDEGILATPALVDGKIYLRTDKQMYAFGER